MADRTDRGDDEALAGADAALGETLPGRSDVASAPTLDSSRAFAAAGAAAAPRRGSMLDHFVVLEELGSGGMGVVLAAYDTELDRKVAIKLLRPDRSAGSSEATARTRLMREAQALARLSHPNVITVYEVATFDDQVAIVMEYVDGETLTAWLKARRRPWRQVVDVIARAGLGLAAAHDAGLVHRDFKPDNVLVGKDGRVRVTDFGLVGTTATPIPAQDEDRAGELPALSASSPLSVTVTYGGALVGTPAYMAPEQLRPHDTDAKTDQFSFCITLYEGLYGERPFEGRTYFELRDAVQLGKVREPPKGSDVPAWLRAAVLRGVRPDPADRYGSMQELLEELRRDPAQLRRRVAGAAGVFGLAALAVFGLVRGGDEPASRCTGGAGRLAGVWDGDVRANVEAAFSETERDYAAETFGVVARGLDERATAWVDAWTDACEATHVRGEQSEHLLDLRMHCLDRRRGEMGALTSLLARAPDPEILDKAASAVAALTPVDACADTTALASAIPLPDDPTLRAEVETLRARLDEITALRDSGKYPDGIELATVAAKDARELGYAPARAEALHALASLLARAGDPKRAEAVLYETLQAAADARDHTRVADTWIALIHLIGARDARHAEALALRPAAEAAVAQAGGDDVQRASLLTSLGLVLSSKGEFEAARELHERALAIQERAFGPEHPRVAMTLGNLANALAEQGRYAEARVHYERALPIQERALGANHPDIAFTLNNLANVLSYEGDNELAKRHFERGLAIWEASLAPNHPLIATCLNNLGSVASALHDTDAAADYYERALRMLEATFGTDHPAAGTVLGNLGENDVDRGEYDLAIARCDRALAVMEAALGSDNPDLAFALTCTGRALLGKGRARAALRPLERALALREPNPGDPLDLATTRFALARALWDAGGDRGRAVELAREAHAAYEAAGEHQRVEREEVAAALARWSAP